MLAKDRLEVDETLGYTRRGREREDNRPAIRLSMVRMENGSALLDRMVQGPWARGAHAIGADSRAISGWNGPRPFKVVNNCLEGAWERLIFGGA